METFILSISFMSIDEIFNNCQMTDTELHNIHIAQVSKRNSN